MNNTSPSPEQGDSVREQTKALIRSLELHYHLMAKEEKELKALINRYRVSEQQKKP